jgi:hypothetical protein
VQLFKPRKSSRYGLGKISSPHQQRATWQAAGCHPPAGKTSLTVFWHALIRFKVDRSTTRCT